ncbi:ABC transporter permease, partial [candidate division NPL-UPA2 bacterium]|nr:ABC transporter permease [candidate division NPL-UPA2 bacterium]
APRMGAVISRFTLQDAAAIANLAQVRRVSPAVFGGAQLVSGNKNWNSRVQGVGIDFPLMRAAIPTAGRFFSEAELNRRRRVALLGTTVVRELFDDANPLGSTIRINRQNFQVIGILPERGADPGRDRDDMVVIPVTTAMYRLLGRRHLDAIDVEIIGRPLMAEGQQAIEELIVRRHGLGGHGQGAFSIHDMAEIRELIEGTARTMNWLLGSIAAISLLVGGIGIMSIMLVSVTERTREIGLRKAIGADKKDIMTQFLVESVVMTFVGGILGIMLGIAIAMILSALAGWPTIVNLSSVILATTFSLVIGITFGLWPAYQAAKLKPIEAIRYE